MTIHVVHLYACDVPRGICKQRSIDSLKPRVKADQRYGMVMTITILLTAASHPHWHRPPTNRSLPLSHRRTANENNHEPIHNFPCIPQP